MDVEIKPNGVVVGLDSLIDAGNIALAKLWAANANVDAIEALQDANKALQDSRDVIHAALQMLHDKDAALETVTAERDTIADAYHDQTAKIDELNQTVEEQAIALEQWQRWYQEQSQ